VQDLHAAFRLDWVAEHIKHGYVEQTMEVLMNENESARMEHPGDQTAPPIDANFRAALALLAQARKYALDAGADLWDFALENDILYEASLTISDLRWLVAKGFAEHGQETSFYGDPHRSFRLSSGLNFVRTSCFVLTPLGADFANKVLNDSVAGT
jgi:hypothetical protein